MKRLSLSVENRTVRGKEVKHLRRDGIVPVVVYGAALDEPQSLQVSSRELERILSHAGPSTVIDLQQGGRALPVLTRAVQRHPLRHTITHVDFLAVRMDRTIVAAVPLHFVGESSAVEAKSALLMQPADSIEVEALPDNLPAALEVDVSVLTEVGQHLTAADLTLPENVTLVTDGETQIASLIPPALTLEEEDALVAEAEGEEEETVEGEEDDAESAEAEESDDER